MTHLHRFDHPDGGVELFSPLALKYRDEKPLEIEEVIQPLKRSETHGNSLTYKQRRKAVHEALEASVRRS
jgi:hypothetical protein